MRFEAPTPFPFPEQSAFPWIIVYGEGDHERQNWSERGVERHAQTNFADFLQIVRSLVRSPVKASDLIQLAE